MGKEGWEKCDVSKLIENNTRQTKRAKILVWKVLYSLNHIFSPLLCKLAIFEFEKINKK